MTVTDLHPSISDDEIARLIIDDAARLDIPDGTSLLDCERIAGRLASVTRNHQFKWGDLLVYVEQWGEEGDQILDPAWEEVISNQRNWRWVASAFPPHLRHHIDTLTWTHYRAATGLDTEKQRLAALDYAAAEHLSTRDFERHVKNLKGADSADDDVEDDSVPGTVGRDLLISVPRSFADDIDTVAKLAVEFIRGELRSRDLEDGEFTLTVRSR